MGAVVQENGNNAQKTGRRRFPPGKIRKGPHRIFNGNPPPSLLSMPNMRPRMPPPGRMMPPRMRLMGPPAPGMRPPPPFRGGPLHPPHNMMRGPGPRGPPPLGMRPPPPGMRPPPPGMRPPPPHMRPPMPPPLMGPQRGPRRGFRSGPPPLLPPDKMRRMQHGKIIKKKKQMYNDNDLSKPWVTENVKLEYTKKEELLKAAKSSKQPTDWATYREQRDKCSKMYAAAKMEYIGQHPEEAYKMEEDSLSEEEGDESEYIQENYSGMNQQSSSAGFICDTCEREFQTYWQHQKHMGEHRTCGIDGCTFTAHEKIIEKHIRMQHSSGLYDKIRNLVTPEDISKWIEERKKKYPKKENVEKRYKQQEEMLKRGEKLQRNSSRFDKNNRARFSLNRQNQSQQKTFKKRTPSKRKIAQQQQQKKPISLIDDKSDWNGTLFPFKGTSQLYDKEPVEIINNFDDTEWLEETPPATPTKIVLKNALGALMSAYDSGDDSETENLPKNEDKPKVELHKENIPKLENIQTVKIEVPVITTPSDDEAPTEQKIERLDTLSETASAPIPSDNKGGRKRKRVHKKGCNKQQKQGFNDNSNNDKSKSIYKKRRVTLLERLLASEITHERNVLLQCVRYVVTNGFFDTEISDDKSKIIGENLCIPDDKTTEASVI